MRIDANLTPSQKIWSSYSTRDNNRISGTPQILPYPIDPNTWKQDFETHFWRLGWDYSITPTLLNHLIVGSNRSNSKNYAVPIISNTDWFSTIGIGNATSQNFPVITNGFTTQEGMPNNGDNVDNGLRVVESISWQKGQHSLTFGTDDRYQQYSPAEREFPNDQFLRVRRRRWIRTSPRPATAWPAKCWAMPATETRTFLRTSRAGSPGTTRDTCRMTGR